MNKITDTISNFRGNYSPLLVIFRKLNGATFKNDNTNGFTIIFTLKIKEQVSFQYKISLLKGLKWINEILHRL